MSILMYEREIYDVVSSKFEVIDATLKKTKLDTITVFSAIFKLSHETITLGHESFGTF